MFLFDGIVISISLQVEFSECLTIMCGLFSTDWHVPRDVDVVVFILPHSLWLVLVPSVCNLDIMFLTYAPV